ncbi:unnamed protein product (macronuclear) [Paramecium tetraurelia]|uniref:Potassium channel domain-containing protein n=1 Tax=Paramecium tetraurelia TaxID=5888 RepID=A0DRM9_PARTE|nr:uncharacterized protein GSPATT00019414001 [Paramecium tetraurelia]CAK85696.1 unnamed protein product [Paramecium tetraurelia]|eukprot:XP_001453093.1 hypothetical protein (macronuclear) [Paramecium tetraurelia strain d4-2]
MNNKCELIIQENGLEIERSLDHSIIRSPQAEQLISSSNKQTLLKFDSSFAQESFQKRKDSLSSQNLSDKNQMITTIARQKQFSKLLIYCHSMKFANRLISLIKPCSKFSIEQFNMINDKASFFNNNLQTKKQTTKHFVQQNLRAIDFQFRWRLQLRKFKKRLFEYLHYQYQQIPLIEPESQKLFIWDILLNIIRIYLIISIPIIMVFQNQQLESKNRIMILFSSVLLLLDLFLRCITIVYDKGYPVDNRYLLIKRQIKLSNLFEVCSIFIGIYLSIIFNDPGFNHSILDQNGWIKLLLILFLIQIKNVVKFMNNIQYYYKPNKEMSSVIDLIKLVGLILLIQHLCSCVWLIIGINQISQHHQTWIYKVYLESWEVQYLEAFYFMSVTMFTVGYGDINPQNSLEKVFCICYMFLSTLQLSYSVNTIGAILTLLKEKNEIFRQKMTCMNEFLKDKNISQQLQYKIREFCTFYWEQDIIQKKNEQQLLIKELPDELQYQLKLEQARQLVNKCTFFKQHFAKSTIQYIIQRVQFTSFQPGTLIQITPSNNGVFVIERGNIEVIYNKTKISDLKDFDQFGFQEYINNQYNLDITYQTTTYTSVLCIPYQILTDAIKKSKSDFEKIQIKKQITKFHYCYICKSTKHSFESCKLVHYVADKEKSIKTYLLVDNQPRIKVKRSNRLQKFQTMIQQESLETSCKLIQQEFEKEIEQYFPELTYEALIKPLNSSQKIFESPKDNEVYRPQKQNYLLETIKTSQGKTYDKFGNNLSLTFRNNQDISPFIKEPDILKDLQLKMINIQKYPQKQQIELFILYKTLENQSQADLEIGNFEIVKKFRKFDRLWNISNVIEQLNCKYEHSRLYLDIIKRLSKYLLFPLDFIYLFKKDLLKQRAESYQNRKIKDSDDEKSDNKLISPFRKFERRKALIYPKSLTFK